MARAKALRLGVVDYWLGTAADTAADTVAALAADRAGALGSLVTFQAQGSLLEFAGAVL